MHVLCSFAYKANNVCSTCVVSKFLGTCVGDLCKGDLCCHLPTYIVEAAGGQCLPCVVDIREESQLKDAVDQAIQKFGGIDILINNASAINVTGTLDTSMKKYLEVFHVP